MGQTPSAPVKFFEAARASALLSVLFLVVYGGCNWFTSTRQDVGMLYFAWERHIPFVPLMIVPYMSIDLFFVVAPFLCGSRRELQIFSRRIVFAILVAGACFLLFPLRFAFERPHADGWLGAVFDWFRTMDQPYNLLPSMHIALRMFLGVTYARHTRGLANAASHLWFTLIGLSTLLTYQHHVMDVVGGFALAGYSFYLFREEQTKLPVTPNLRVGGYYAMGAILLGLLVLVGRGWWVLLLWPAVALGIVASAYFGKGPGIYRKIQGRLPKSTWWVLGPCLLGQYASLLHYRRQCRAWDAVLPKVWIGRKLNNREATAAVQAGVTAVLDLTAEFSEAAPFRAVRYRNIPILDLTAPTLEQLREMAAFIATEAESGVVYVHCKIGYSRSAAAVAAWLLLTGEAASVGEALARLREARPSIIVRPEVLSVLEELMRDASPGVAAWPSGRFLRRD